MLHFTNSETDTFDDVTKALNILVDKHNENEVYNAEVEEYNKSIVKSVKKTTKKKGGK